MERDSQDVARQTILRRYAEVRAGRPLKVTTDADQFMTNTKTVKTQK